MSSKMSVSVKGLKVTTLISAEAIPVDLVPPEPQPAGNPVIEIQIEGSPFVARAILNGKSVRRALKIITEHGPGGVNVLLQGNLKPASPGGPWILDCPGLTVTPKATPTGETS